MNKSPGNGETEKVALSSKQMFWKRVRKIQQELFQQPQVKTEQVW